MSLEYSFISLPSSLGSEDSGVEYIQKGVATSWASMAAWITAQSVFEMFAFNSGVGSFLFPETSLE